MKVLMKITKLRFAANNIDDISQQACLCIILFNSKWPDPDDWWSVSLLIDSTSMTKWNQLRILTPPPLLPPDIFLQPFCCGRFIDPLLPHRFGFFELFQHFIPRQPLGWSRIEKFPFWIVVAIQFHVKRFDSTRSIKPALCRPYSFPWFTSYCLPVVHNNTISAGSRLSVYQMLI